MSRLLPLAPLAPPALLLQRFLPQTRSGALSGRNAENYQLSQELASGTALNVRLLIDKATGYWENDAPEVAARLYEEALKRNPAVVEKLEAMTHLGWCLYLQKDNDRAEKLWKAVIASVPQGDRWRGESRWRLVVLSAGVRNDRNKARELCAEQFAEFKGTFLGRQAKLTQAWLYMVDKQWSEAKRHFEELAATYPDQNNEQIAKYIADCESGLRSR